MNISQNRKVFHEYTVLDSIDVGIVLTGNEVKSAKNKHVNLVGSFGVVSNNQLNLINCHISHYQFAYKGTNVNPLRTRILLATKDEIIKLMFMIKTKRVVLVPLSMFLTKGKVKIKLGICRHKKAYDRKEEIKERDIARSTKKELKESQS